MSTEVGRRLQLPEDEVRRHQRRRLIEAIAALCSERGYANVVISGIVSRAAVSKSTFYRFYEAKSDCLFDAHKHYSATLLAEIDSAAAGEDSRPVRMRSVIRAALAYCAANPDVALLLSAGILSTGPEGARRYRATTDAIASRLCGPGQRPNSDRGSAIAAVVFAAPMTSLALAADSTEVPSLESELVEIALSFAERS